MEADNKNSCSLFLENIDDYADAQLDEDKIEAIRAHLETCGDCRERLNEYTSMLKALADLDRDTTIPIECQASWRRAVRGEAKHVSKRKTLKNIARAAASVAAAAVVVTGVTLLVNNPLQKGMPTASPAGYSYAYDEAAYESEYASVTGVNAAPMSKAAPRTLVQSDGEFDEGSIESAADQNVDGDLSLIIRNASRKIESANFDQCVRSITDLVEEYQGYFEQSTVEGQPIEPGMSNGRVARMTARVPAVDLDAFLVGVDAVGTITYSRITADDISEDYYDTKTRLEGYKTQLKRLNELVLTAADLEQLLMLEDKITSVQYDIDSLEGTLKSWTNKVNYSTISLTVTETSPRDRIVAPSQSLGDRAKTAFYDSINWLNEALQAVVVALAAFAPALVVIVPLAAVIFIIVKLATRKKKK